MADQFGGIPLEEPQTDQFGGVPVSNQYAAPAPASQHALSAVYGNQQFTDLGSAAIHHAGNFLHGTAQTIEHGLNYLTGGALQDTVNKDDAAMRAREAAYQASQPDSAATNIGAGSGELLPFMVGGVPKMLNWAGAKAAGVLPETWALARKALSGGVQGGLVGASQPVTGDGSYASQKAAQVGLGTLTGGTIPIAAKAVMAPVGVYRALTASPEARAVTRSGELLTRAGLTPEMLRGQGKVPGYAPSIPEVAPSGKAVQLQRALQNDPHAGPVMADQHAANQAALNRQISAIAGTDAQLANAKVAARQAGDFWKQNLARGGGDARYLAGSKLLDQAANSRSMLRSEKDILDRARIVLSNAHSGKMDALAAEHTLDDLEPKTPFARNALAQARTIINKGMINPSPLIADLQGLARSTNSVVRTAAEKHLADISRNQTDSTGWVHASVLDGIRQNLNRDLSNSLTGKIDSTAAAEYVPLRNKIVRTLERNVPGFSDSVAAYRIAKQPINDMQAGRQLRDAINNGGRDVGGNQDVSLAKVNSFLQKDSRNRYPTSGPVRNRLADIMDTLQQRTIADKKISASGSNTSADAAMLNTITNRLAGWGGSLGRLAGYGVGGAMGMPMVGDLVSGEVGGALGQLVKGRAAHINAETMQRVGQHLKTAKGAADVLDIYMRASPEQRSVLLNRYPQITALLLASPPSRRVISR